MRIVSDGTPKGTKVFDNSGNEIRHIQKVGWSISVEGVPVVTLIIADDVEIDVTATEDNVFMMKKSSD